MGWATNHIQRLQAGETIKFRPRGNSMTGKVSSGQLCTVVPITHDTIVDTGDVILCKVTGREFLHIVTAITRDNSTGNHRYRISNNHGYVNGWTRHKQVYGKLVNVED
jgi:hypothetical protein